MPVAQSVFEAYEPRPPAVYAVYIENTEVLQKVAEHFRGIGLRATVNLEVDCADTLEVRKVTRSTIGPGVYDEKVLFNVAVGQWLGRDPAKRDEVGGQFLDGLFFVAGDTEFRRKWRPTPKG